LRTTLLSASAMSARCLQAEPLPFTCRDACSSFFSLIRVVRNIPISSAASGLHFNFHYLTIAFFLLGVGLLHPYPHEQGDPARSQRQKSKSR
jgi:hypothetical protein